MAGKILTDDEFFGVPSADTIRPAESSALLSDEDFFGPATPTSMRPSGFGSGLAAPTRYLGKNLETGEVPDTLDRLKSASMSGLRAAGTTAGSMVQDIGIMRADGAKQALFLMDRLDRGEEVSQADTANMPAYVMPQINRYLRATPEERAAIRSDIEAELPPLDPRESQFYKAGGAVSDAAESTFQPDPRFEGEFWTDKVPQGIGSMATFAGVGLAGRAIGVNPLLTTAAAGATANATGQFQDALENGASIETALKAATEGRQIGALEALPISRALDRLDKTTGGGVRKILAETLKGATEEAIQETVNAILNNLSAQGLYDPERDLLEGAADGAAVGGVTGGILSFVTSLVGSRRGAGTTAAPSDPAAPPAVPLDNLTPDDIASPAPNELIAEGRAIVDSLLAGNDPAVAPAEPAPPPTPAPEPAPAASSALEDLYDDDGAVIGKYDPATGQSFLNDAIPPSVIAPDQATPVVTETPNAPISSAPEIAPEAAQPLASEPISSTPAEAAPVGTVTQDAAGIAPAIQPVDAPSRPRLAEPVATPESRPSLEGRESVSLGIGGIRLTPLADKPTLYRETNAEGLRELVMASFTNNQGGDASSAFVTDDPALAIGQGANKGITVTLRGAAVSGEVNQKPATGIIGGSEYKLNFVGQDAIDTVTVAPGAKVDALTRTVLGRFFDRTKAGDGKVTYRRKGLPEEAAPTPAPAAQEAPTGDLQQARGLAAALLEEYRAGVAELAAMSKDAPERSDAIARTVRVAERYKAEAGDSAQALDELYRAGEEAQEPFRKAQRLARLRTPDGLMQEALAWRGAEQLAGRTVSDAKFRAHLAGLQKEAQAASNSVDLSSNALPVTEMMESSLRSERASAKGARLRAINAEVERRHAEEESQRATNQRLAEQAESAALARLRATTIDNKPLDGEQVENLITRFGSAQAAVSALPSLVKGRRGQPKPIVSIPRADAPRASAATQSAAERATALAGAPGVSSLIRRDLRMTGEFLDRIPVTGDRARNAAARTLRAAVQGFRDGVSVDGPSAYDTERAELAEMIDRARGAGVDVPKMSGPVESLIRGGVQSSEAAKAGDQGDMVGEAGDSADLAEPPNPNDPLTTDQETYERLVWDAANARWDAGQEVTYGTSGKGWRVSPSRRASMRFENGRIQALQGMRKGKQVWVDLAAGNQPLDSLASGLGLPTSWERAKAAPQSDAAREPESDEMAPRDDAQRPFTISAILGRVDEPNVVEEMTAADLQTIRDDDPDGLDELEAYIRERRPELFEGGDGREAIAVAGQDGPALSVSPDDMNYQRAVRAHSGMSFSPEKRAREDQQAYVQDVQSLYDEMLPLATTDAQRAILTAEVERYRQGYLERAIAVQESRSRIMSPMIAGPANFPVARNKKRMDAFEKLAREFSDWQQKARRAARAAVQSARDAGQVQGDTWAKLKAEIDEDVQNARASDAKVGFYMDRPTIAASLSGRLIRAANRGEVETVREALEYIREQQTALDKPLFTNRHMVWGLVERAEKSAAGAEATTAEGEVEIATFDGARIVDNREAGRVQIVMDGKPADEVRDALRGEGWRWAPSAGAWQRQNTPNAVASAKRIVGKFYAAAPAPEKASLRLTPAFEKRIPAVQRDLDARMQQLGLTGRVSLELTDMVRSLRTGEEFENADGMYSPMGAFRLIQVAMGAADPMATLNHEAIHALREMRLLYVSEWSALKRAAAADTARMAEVRERYADMQMTEEDFLEEAVADMYSEWAAGRMQAGGFIRKAFEKIKAFLEALGSVLAGNGFKTVDSIFQGIESGATGRRQPGDFAQAAESDMGMAPEAADIGERASLRRPRTGQLLGTPIGQPQASVVEVLTDTSLPILQRMGALKDGAAISEQVDRWRTNMQDQFLPMFRVQQQIETQLGRPLDEREDPYLQQELSTGKIGAKLEDLADDLVAPLYEGMHAAGVSVAELETFLYARHAKERNAKIGAINPKFGPGEGSGMTDQEADDILAAVDQSGKRRDLERLAARVDSILDFALQTRVDSGLLSPQEALAWRRQYKHYVPLRGSEELDPEVSADRPRRGSGINVTGKESHRAFGRESRAVDILAYSIMQAEEAIIRAETNEVAKSLYNLASNNPDAGFWAADKIAMRPVFDKTTGQVRYEASRRLLAEDKDYTVTAKIDGVEHRVTFERKNPAAVRLATSMRNLSSTQFGAWVATVGKLNRYLSMVNTQLNPEFVIVNAFRDLQTGLINLEQFNIQRLSQNTLKDYPAAMKASMQSAFKKGSGPWGNWADEFRREGGRVYFNQIDDINTLRARVKKDFEMAAPGLSSRKAIVGLFRTIEQVNLGVEQAIRLSAYKNAREAGMTPARAASLAKNLTVNFNRKGIYGPLMNSLYLFYNAGIQGTATLLTAAKSKRVQKVLGAAVMTGAILELLNQLVLGDDGDDDEPVYDKISDFDKSRNLIVMLPGTGGKHIKIPLPYGYNVFFHMGRAAVELVSGKKRGKVGQVGGELLQSFVESFNPLGGAESLLNFIAPTVADPIVDLSRNRDYADRPIMPEELPYGTPQPNSQRYWTSVSAGSRLVTDFLNDVTGGDQVRPGVIDISPEVLDHMFAFATGAAGSFLGRAVDLPLKLLDPQADVGINDFPLVRKVVGSAPSWYAKSALYERSKKIEAAVDYMKRYSEKGDRDSARALRDEAAKLLRMKPLSDASRKVMADIRKERASLRQRLDAGKIEKPDYNARMDRLKEREKETLTRFNKAWNNRVGED
jgi:hypothetical protein